jgi:uncharacterized membrane protein
MGHLPYFIEILVILKIALSLGLTCVLRHNSRVYLGSRDAREQAARRRSGEDERIKMPKRG